MAKLDSIVLFVSYLSFWINSVKSLDDEDKKGINIKSFHVTSGILYRFSTTEIESVVTNDADEIKEAFFDVKIPKQAFISNFTLEIDGKVYPGDVQEKIRARKTYERAKKRGQSTGIIATKGKETNAFKVSIGVRKHGEVKFRLTYQELLQRTLGMYEHVLFVRPRDIVRDVKIEIFIKDVRDITKLQTPTIQNRVIRDSDDDPIPLEESVIERPTPKSAHIIYRPSTEFQSTGSQKGMDIIFSVKYDVAREFNAGDLLVSNGYFVHFFAPSGLKPLPKDIVFILDVSGSMRGRKLAQMKDAMMLIISELNEQDRLNVIKFSSGSIFWKEGLVYARQQAKASALSYVANLRATGGTNINEALLDGLVLLREQQTDSETENRRGVVLFLTDGEATMGVIPSDQILSNIREANNGIPVFGLSFGTFADFSLLRSLSAQNDGFARKIYEGSDASSQLTDFYRQISDITMSDISFNYVNDSADDATLTLSTHKNLYEGSELVVAGKLSGLSSELTSVIDGRTETGHVTIEPTVEDVSLNEETEFVPKDSKPDAFMERLWAFMTIRQLLDKQYSDIDKDAKEKLKNDTIDMALKYNFVTPLTSMVVVKPEVDEKTDLNEEPDDGEEQDKLPNPGKPSRPRSPSRPRPQSLPPPPAVSVDSDPHFIIKVNGLADSICFDVMGTHGDVVNLVYDELSGVIVNARVVAERGFRKKRKVNTYLGAIQILRNKFSLHASPKKVKMGKKILLWDEEKTVTTKTAMVRVNRRALAVAFDNGVLLAVFRHLRKNRRHRDYVGFYIANATGLSNETHGLLGQFMFSNFSLTKSFIRAEKTEGRLKIVSPREPQGKYVMATVGHRRNLAVNRSVSCWMINHVGNIIEGTYEDYVADGMTSTDHSLWYPYFQTT